MGLTTGRCEDPKLGNPQWGCQNKEVYTFMIRVTITSHKGIEKFVFTLKSCLPILAGDTKK